MGGGDRGGEKDAGSGGDGHREGVGGVRGDHSKYSEVLCFSVCVCVFYPALALHIDILCVA